MEWARAASARKFTSNHHLSVIVEHFTHNSERAGMVLRGLIPRRLTKLLLHQRTAVRLSSNLFAREVATMD
jgi:hypothetical protein